MIKRSGAKVDSSRFNVVLSWFDELDARVFRAGRLH
jgi:hypothetical protein